MAMRREYPVSPGASGYAAAGFRPFGANGAGGSGPYREPHEAQGDPLVLDAWRHRQVDAGRYSPTPPAGAQRSLGTLDATLSSLREDQRMQSLSSGLGGAHPAMNGQSPVYAKAMQNRSVPPMPAHGNMSVSLGDLHLSPGNGYSSLSLDASGYQALHPQQSIAEMSLRRRDAIKAAFRRVDAKGQGWVTIQELAMGLQRFSNLGHGEQDRVGRAMAPPGARPGVDWNGQISFATFAGYYQTLGSTIERDRDFEDLMRHHWGFSEVSDILDDMKNKFAMVGLAYAFRRCLEHGGSPEMSMTAFQDAIGSVGMHYSNNDVRRIFDAFDSRGGAGLEVLRLTQHLTSAPRPPTPIPTLYGTEVNSQAEGDMAHSLAQSGYSSVAFHPGFSTMARPGTGDAEGRRTGNPGDLLPPTVPAPPEDEHGVPEWPHPRNQPPLAPPEEDDPHGMPKAPPEKHAAADQIPPEAPPEDDCPQAPPPEKDSNQHDTKAAPRELEMPSAPPQHHQAHHQGHHVGHHVGHHGHYGHHGPPVGASPSSMPVSPMRDATAASPSMQSSSPSGGRRRAVTIGLNYIGLKCQLSGCINDSDTFISLLTEEFGYSVADIRQLRDDHPHRMPTKKNISAAIHWLVKDARPGDHLFLHYSGHGTQVKDEDGDEADGKDEALVPCDYQTAGFIVDDDLRRMIAAKLPKGCRITVILDCCHSGTALDLAYKVQIGEGGKSIDIEKTPQHKMPPPAEADIVMLSGCMDNQTSADAGVGLAGNKLAAGAMTTAFKLVISKHPNASYMNLIAEMRKFLKVNNFTQVPQLSSDHAITLSDCFMPEAHAAAQAMEPPPPVATRPPARKALTIGINYLTLWPGKGRLSGCINDSDTIIGILKDTFGFQDSQICRLRDDRANMMPTKANMLASMRWLTHGAGPQDELFLHYSGHGGQQKDEDGDEESGKDQTLIPCDFQHAGQITDDELHAHLVQHLPKGCTLWVILDCCHSGTALDLSYKVALSDDGTKCQLTRSTQKRPSEAEVIMISGCKDDQTSADVQGGSMGATKAAGAMTTALRHCVNTTISCHDLLMSMRAFLKQNKYEQVPQMSSEKCIQLDAPFVNYEGKNRADRVKTEQHPQGSPAPVHSRDLGGFSQSSPPQSRSPLRGSQGTSPLSASFQQAPTRDLHGPPPYTATQSHSPQASPGWGQSHSPQGTAIGFPPGSPQHPAYGAAPVRGAPAMGMPQSPMMAGAMTPTHQVYPDDRQVIDSRISRLEEQINVLRTQQLSPQQSHFSPGMDGFPPPPVYNGFNPGAHAGGF